jgi:hypothetical protein
MFADLSHAHAYDLSHAAHLSTRDLDMTVVEMPNAVLASSASCVGTASTVSTIGGTAGTAATSGTYGCGGGAAEDITL